MSSRQQRTAGQRRRREHRVDERRREKTVKGGYGLISTRQGIFSWSGAVELHLRRQVLRLFLRPFPFPATLSPSPVFVAVIAVTRTLRKCWLSPIRPSIFMKFVDSSTLSSGTGIPKKQLCSIVKQTQALCIAGFNNGRHHHHDFVRFKNTT